MERLLPEHFCRCLLDVPCKRKANLCGLLPSQLLTPGASYHQVCMSMLTRPDWAYIGIGEVRRDMTIQALHQPPKLMRQTVMP